MPKLQSTWGFIQAAVLDSNYEIIPDKLHCALPLTRGLPSVWAAGNGLIGAEGESEWKKQNEWISEVTPKK
ncbi:hypothetical protein OBV_14860 [Oscillibacter valericigenes Sjm18-20]|nr:hypothetical protein OBV_14860 [Oscillibacter valericigenes Sjm18-20]